jgi:hypothetical protein
MKGSEAKCTLSSLLLSHEKRGAMRPRAPDWLDPTGGSREAEGVSQEVERVPGGGKHGGD